MAGFLIFCQSGGVSYYEFETLRCLPGLRHAVFTRIGGVSVGALASLNVGSSVGDDPAKVTENQRRALAVLGARTDQVVTCHQVHGANVHVACRNDRGTVFSSCDGMVTVELDLALMLRFADCVPVLLFDPVRRTLALLHAGWRGMIAGVVHAGLRRMSDEFASAPADIIAGVGPAIGPCCYQVGPEVVSAALDVLGSAGHSLVAERSGATYLDLPGAVEMQLQQAGVKRIELSGMCTSCCRDKFFSHRGDGGRTGRFAVVASLA